MSENTETITLGGGCFWCVEAVYLDLEGVLEVVSGYAGGQVPDPTYKQVCSGSTGHAEVVKVTFDPSVIELAEVLRVFFAVHDPTTLNRQGNDVGTQYRSVILVGDDAQERVAREVLQEVEDEGIWDDPIVTEIAGLKTFYPAEEYHQNYFARNPNQPYCQVVVAPKVAKFRKRFAHRLRSAG